MSVWSEVKNKTKELLRKIIKALFHVFIDSLLAVLTGSLELLLDYIILFLNKLCPETIYTIGHHFILSVQLVYCTHLDKLKNITVENFNIFHPGAPYARKIAGQNCDYYDSQRYFSAWQQDREDFNSCVPATQILTSPTDIIANTTIEVYKPNIFGGIPDGQGGIDACAIDDAGIDIMFGKDDQGINAHIAAVIAEELGDVEFVPTYRGMFGILFKHTRLGYNTNQLRPTSIDGTRTTTRYEELMIAAGDPTRATDYKIPSTFIIPSTSDAAGIPEIVGEDLNPAFIILDCLLDSWWGGLGFTLWMGDPNISTGDINEQSFHDVAVALYEEVSAGGIEGEDGFGLSMVWRDQETIEAFIYRVLAHINAILYISPDDGRFNLTLVRDGVIPTITLNEDNIISLENYEVKATTENVNKITVNYTDYANEDGKGSVTIDSLASMKDSTAVDTTTVVATSKDYWGISKADLAARIAERDLKEASTPLSSITVLINRTAYTLKPGDVFTFEWPDLGIADMTMRVLKIDISPNKTNVMRIDAMADIFSFEDAVLTTTPGTGWKDPATKPPEDIDSSLIRAWEPSYVEVINRIESFDDTKAYLTHSCINPSIYYTGYRYLDKVEADDTYTDHGQLPFASSYFVIVDQPLILEQTSTVYTAENVPSNISAILAGGDVAVGLIEYELVTFVRVTDTREILVIRGSGDTVPETHAAGNIMRFYALTMNMGSFMSPLELSPTDIAAYKLLSATATATLDESAATEHTLAMTGRIIKPYPPGHVLINGEAYPERMTFRIMYTDPMYAITQNEIRSFETIESDTPEIDSTVDFRLIIPKEKLTNLGLGTIKIKFSDMCSDWFIKECFIGLVGNGTYNPYDFYVAPTKVTFNWGADGTDIFITNTSDAVAYLIDGSRDVMISFTAYTDSGGSMDLCYASVSTGKTYYKELVDEAGTTIPQNGYSEINSVLSLEEIREGDVELGPYTRISWYHRDRVSQGTELIGQDKAVNYGPEAGTTYTLRIFNGLTLVRTIQNITDTKYDYTMAQEKIDNGGQTITAFRFELEATRSGSVSNFHNISFTREGFGLNYGNSYGD